MTSINFGSRVSLKEAAQFIAAVGTTNNVMLRGPKGIGKTSILPMLREYLGDEYEYACFDMTAKAEGDTAIPFPDKEAGVMRFFTNEALKLTTGKPVCIILDELAKAPRSIQNMVLPMLENPRRVADKMMPAGSMAIVTCNLSEEGLGDTFLAHTMNRMTVVEVRQPSVEEWLVWGAANGIHPVVLAWVNQTPTALASFRDDDFDPSNPYVDNPKRVQVGQVVTPRSLEKASHIVWQREKFTENMLLAGLIGTIGEPAARDMQHFIAFQDELPARELILKSPDTAPIPTSVGAIITLLFNLERAVEADTISAIMKYVSRMEAEHQAVFCTSLARSKTKQTIAFRNADFTKWAAENADIL
jgi:hypothetical protein